MEFLRKRNLFVGDIAIPCGVRIPPPALFIKKLYGVCKMAITINFDKTLV
jgi:hypothetical protein